MTKPFIHPFIGSFTHPLARCPSLCFPSSLSFYPSRTLVFSCCVFFFLFLSALLTGSIPHLVSPLSGRGRFSFRPGQQLPSFQLISMTFLPLLSSSSLRSVSVSFLFFCPLILSGCWKLSFRPRQELPSFELARP